MFQEQQRCVASPGTHFRPYTRRAHPDGERRVSDAGGGNDFADPTVVTDDNDLVHHKREARATFEENLRNAGLQLEYEEREVRSSWKFPHD